jgi:hypothetical protein
MALSDEIGLLASCIKFGKMVSFATADKIFFCHLGCIFPRPQSNLHRLLGMALSLILTWILRSSLLIRKFC